MTTEENKKLQEEIREALKPTFRTSRCNHLILFVSISFD
jgi:hypothetical protein